MSISSSVGNTAQQLLSILCMCHEQKSNKRNHFKTVQGDYIGLSVSKSGQVLVVLPTPRFTRPIGRVGESMCALKNRCAPC